MTTSGTEMKMAILILGELVAQRIVCKRFPGYWRRLQGIEEEIARGDSPE